MNFDFWNQSRYLLNGPCKDLGALGSWTTRSHHMLELRLFIFISVLILVKYSGYTMRGIAAFVGNKRGKDRLRAHVDLWVTVTRFRHLLK